MPPRSRSKSPLPAGPPRRWCPPSRCADSSTPESAIATERLNQRVAPTEEATEAFRNEYYSWNEYNEQLLRGAFDSAEVAEQYSGISVRFGRPHGPPERYKGTVDDYRKKPAQAGVRPRPPPALQGTRQPGSEHAGAAGVTVDRCRTQGLPGPRARLSDQGDRRALPRPVVGGAAGDPARAAQPRSHHHREVRGLRRLRSRSRRTPHGRRQGRHPARPAPAAGPPERHPRTRLVRRQTRPLQRHHAARRGRGDPVSIPRPPHPPRRRPELGA